MSRNPFSSPGRVLSRAVNALALRAGAWALGASALLSVSPPAFAQSEPGEALASEPPPDDVWEPKASSAGIALQATPGFSIGLGAYGGLALLMTRDAKRPHALAGLLTRARYGYAEIGAVIELTDRAPDEWRSVGGFVGAWLPYRNWVDFELAAGLAFRRYLSSESRYGASGYEEKTPAVTLRLGLSDRSSEGSFGARLGGELVAAMDLRRPEAAWQYQAGTDAEPIVLHGTTPVSGFSIGLVLSTGFDVAFRRRSDSAVLGEASRAPRF